MNNRVQQRMDRSISDAVAAQMVGKAQRSADILRNKKRRARELLPATERLIMAGEIKGRPLDKCEIDSLKSIRCEYRRMLGLNVDRKMLEMPTILGPSEDNLQGGKGK